MKTYTFTALVFLIFFLFLLPSEGQTCKEIVSYKVCYNLSLSANELQVRCVPLEATELIIKGQKIRLSKGKIIFIYNKKEKGWIRIQEFYKPIVDDQGDQTTMTELLKREQANHGTVFSKWRSGHKATSKRGDRTAASIALFWMGKGDKKTQCIIYSELGQKHTEELLSSISVTGVK